MLPIVLFITTCLFQIKRTIFSKMTKFSFEIIRVEHIKMNENIENNIIHYFSDLFER